MKCKCGWCVNVPTALPGGSAPGSWDWIAAGSPGASGAGWITYSESKYFIKEPNNPNTWKDIGYASPSGLSYAEKWGAPLKTLTGGGHAAGEGTTRTLIKKLKLDGIVVKLHDIPSTEKLKALANSGTDFRCNYGNWAGGCYLFAKSRIHSFSTSDPDLLVPKPIPNKGFFISDVLVHLNDYHRLTFEEIADILEIVAAENDVSLVIN